MGRCIVSIFQYIFMNMQRYTVYLYLETALHVSGGTSTHRQERIQLYLQHMVVVTPLLLSALSWKSWNRFERAVGGLRQPQHIQTGSNSSTIATDSSNGVTNTRCRRYSCMCSLWWVEVPPETCRAVSSINKLCNVASCWIYIGIYSQCTDLWTLNLLIILANVRWDLIQCLKG
jgi:hypothetical protein